MSVLISDVQNTVEQTYRINKPGKDINRLLYILFNVLLLALTSCSSSQERTENTLDSARPLDSLESGDENPNYYFQAMQTNLKNLVSAFDFSPC